MGKSIRNGVLEKDYYKNLKFYRCDKNGYYTSDLKGKNKVIRRRLKIHYNEVNMISNSMIKRIDDHQLYY